MIDYSAFSQGWNQADDKDRKSRLDNLDAWRKFKTGNPYANFQQLSEYRDALTGGRNYLGDVLPNNDLLQSVADLNAENKGQAELEKNYANMTKQASLLGTMDADIDEALLASGGKKLVDAANNFVGRFENIANTPNLMRRITSRFNEPAYKALVMERTQKNLPRAAAFLKDNPVATSSDIEQHFGLPPAIAEGLHKQAIKMNQRETTEWYSKNRERLIKSALEYGKEGEDVTPWLTRQAELLGEDLDVNSAEFQSLLNLVKARSDRANREKEEKMGEAVSAAATRVRGVLNSSDAVKALVRLNDTDGLRALVEETLSDVPSHVKKSMEENNTWEPWVDGIINSSFAKGAAAQSQTIDAANEKSAEENAARRVKLRERNIKDAREYYLGFEGAKSRGADEKDRVWLPDATEQLARTFYMDASAFGVLNKAWYNISADDATMETLVKTGREALENAGTSHADTMHDHLASQVEIGSGRWIKTQPVEMFLGTMEKAVKKDDGEYQQFQNNIFRSTGSNQKKIGALMRLGAQLTMKAKRYKQELDVAERSAMGDDNWIKVEKDGAQWDRKRAQKLTENLDKKLAEYKQEIMDAIRVLKVEEEAKNADRLGKSSLKRTPAPAGNIPADVKKIVDGYAASYSGNK